MNNYLNKRIFFILNHEITSLRSSIAFAEIKRCFSFRFKLSGASSNEVISFEFKFNVFSSKKITIFKIQMKFA